MKKTSFIFLFFIFLACQPKKKSQNIYEDINKGSFEFLADTSLKYIFDQITTIYLNKFDSTTITTEYLRDEKIIASLKSKNKRIALLHRKLNNNEYNQLLSVYKTIPLERVFAYDAIALAVAKSSNDSIIKLAEFKENLKTKSQQIICLTQDKKLLQDLLKTLEIQVSNYPVLLVESLENMKEYISKNPNTIGIMLFSNFSDEDNPLHRNIRNDFSFLGIQNDTITTYPSQEDIYLKLYPLSLPYNLILCKVARAEGIGFVNFLFKPQVSKLILKNGLVPAIMPERYFEIIEN
jgi:hypothetical protein